MPLMPGWYIGTDSPTAGYRLFSMELRDILELPVMYPMMLDRRKRSCCFFTFQAKWSKLRWWVMQTVRGWNLFSCLGELCKNSRSLIFSSVKDVMMCFSSIVIVMQGLVYITHMFKQNNRQGASFQGFKDFFCPGDSWTGKKTSRQGVLRSYRVQCGQFLPFAGRVWCVAWYRHKVPT